MSMLSNATAHLTNAQKCMKNDVIASVDKAFEDMRLAYEMMGTLGRSVAEVTTAQEAVTDLQSVLVHVLDVSFEAAITAVNAARGNY